MSALRPSALDLASDAVVREAVSALASRYHLTCTVDLDAVQALDDLVSATDRLRALLAPIPPSVEVIREMTSRLRRDHAVR